MHRLLSIPLALLTLLAGSIAWSNSANNERTDYNFAILRDVISLDPNQMSYGQDMRLAYAMWEGLYSYEPITLKPIPGVAERCDFTDDKKIFTFHLRDNARWSN